MSIAEVVRICIWTALTGLAGLFIMAVATLALIVATQLARKYYWEWRNYVHCKKLRGADDSVEEDD